MSSRRWGWYAAAGLAGTAAVAFDSIVDHWWIRLDLVLLVPLLLLALQILWLYRYLDAAAARRLILYCVGSLALVLACVGVGERLAIFAVATPVAHLAMAWIFTLTLMSPAFEGPGMRRWPRPNLGILLALTLAVWAVCVRAVGGLRPYIIDEVLYLLQSAHVWHPPFMQPINASLAPFFALQQTYFRGNFLNGQYPPGWPAVLALFPGPVGHWLLLAGVQLVVIVATYEFGRLVASRRVGVLAAALVALNALELLYAVSFFSEVFTTALVMTGGALFIRGFRTANGPRQVALWMVSGFLAGWAGATRPLTGLVLWVALALMALLLERPSRRAIMVAGLAMAAGAVLPLAYLLWYNGLTTGHALQFGYTLAEHGTQALGFGARGFVRYGRDGLPWVDISSFGAHEAVVNFARSLRQLLATFWPASLILPLAFLARHLGIRARWRLVAPFALLPAAYFFYFYMDVRFFFELLPLAMIGTAWLVLQVLDRRPKAAMALMALMFVTTGVTIRSRALWRSSLDYTYAPVFQDIQRQQEQHPHVLVFVRDSQPDPSKPFFSAMYAYNLIGNFHGPVVVARDLGDANAALLASYPGYVPFLLVDRLPKTPRFEFTPLPSAGRIEPQPQLNSPSSDSTTTQTFGLHAGVARHPSNPLSSTRGIRQIR